MNNSNQHKIKQQCINLDWIGAGYGHHLQTQLSTFLTEQLLPQIETVFDGCCQTDQLLRINKVVLDLGDIAANNWKTTLCNKLTVQLQQQLQQASAQQPSQPLLGSAATNTNTQHHHKNTPLLIDNVLQQFLFFLRYGRLATATTTELNFQQLTQQFNHAQWQQVLQLIKSHKHSRQRLLSQCDSQTLQPLFSTELTVSDIDNVLDFFAPVENTHRLYVSWHTYCRLSLFTIVMDKLSNNSAKSVLQTLWYVRAVIERLSVDNNNKKFDHDQTLHYHKHISGLSQPWKNRLAGLKNLPSHYLLTEADPIRFVRRLLAGEPLSQLLHFASTAQADTPRANARRVDTLSLSDQTKPAPPALGNHIKDQQLIAMEAAGAVIVHPFLKELFSDQQLLDGSNFRNEECRHLAVQMLAYLSFGDIAIEEYDLLLAKLLCAMPWPCALIKIELSATQKHACDQLLMAILKHWQALNSESVHWLRQQFFWRKGQLKMIDEAYKLSVDGGVQDILLSKLPWGIGVIELPWMADTLYVHWQR